MKRSLAFLGATFLVYNANVRAISSLVLAVPDNADFAHHRLWDWKDCLLLRLLRNRPRLFGFMAPVS